MEVRLSKKMLRKDFQNDFIKMMLRAATGENIISFAGGLPNPISFPIKEIEIATKEVLATDGVYALQYSATLGYKPLRTFIVNRYQQQGIMVTPDDILITNGSQQALDILGNVLLDEEDHILLENPAYLAALQAFHLHNVKVHTVNLNKDGVVVDELKEYVEKYDPKFFYAVPTFQNPTGLTYTKETREKAAEIIKNSNTIFIEDNPYGELRFKGEEQDSFAKLLGEQCIMLGTFSKIVSPGMRIGWICCTNKTLQQKMIDYKQIVDLHTNIFGQMVLSRYLEQNDLDQHIAKIKKLYFCQAEAMLQAMKKYFPKSVQYTEPEGGMFLWVTLPEGLTAVELGNLALAKGVAIAPGDPFYESERNVGTFRLNYTNCENETIEKGIAILGTLIYEMLNRK